MAGEGRRTYDLLRAYVGREWERIEGLMERDARTELDGFLNHQAAAEPPTVPVEAAPTEPTQMSGPRPMDVPTAYKVLGLTREATLAQLKAAYKRLSERSLPTNFPEASEERKQAAQVHLRVQEAYEVLLPRLDARLKRFQSLDL